MTLTAFLPRVIDILDGAGVPYMLTGSLAVAYYAAPRATQGVDVVVSADADGIARVVDGFLALGWYADREAAREAVRSQGQFNAIDAESGWKVDVILRKDRPFSKREFERRQKATVLGVETWLTSIEDVLIAKLEWSKLGDWELQRRDVLRLLEQEGDRLDMDYLARWTRQLDLEADWAAMSQLAYELVRSPLASTRS